MFMSPSSSMLELAIFLAGCAVVTLVGAFIVITIRELRRIGRLSDEGVDGTMREWIPGRGDSTAAAGRSLSGSA